jgi:hypothetical protein
MPRAGNSPHWTYMQHLRQRAERDVKNGRGFGVHTCWITPVQRAALRLLQVQ